MSTALRMPDPEGRPATSADVALRDRIARALQSVPALEQSDIGVQVVGSHITLAGTVATLAQEQLALDTVVQCDGVRMVVSLLCIVSPDEPFDDPGRVA